MSWVTVSSQFCFCWLYRASPSLAAKNIIINMISVLTIWWCPCVVFFCVVGRGCLLWPVCSLGKTPLVFDLLCFVLQGQICVFLPIIILQFDKIWSKWQTWILPPNYLSRHTDFLTVQTEVPLLVQESEIEIIKIHFYYNNNNKFLYYWSL